MPYLKDIEMPYLKDIEMPYLKDIEMPYLKDIEMSYLKDIDITSPERRHEGVEHLLIKDLRGKLNSIPLIIDSLKCRQLLLITQPQGAVVILNRLVSELIKHLAFGPDVCRKILDMCCGCMI